jgi:hypothetical protein
MAFEKTDLPVSLHAVEKRKRGLEISLTVQAMMTRRESTNSFEGLKSGAGPDAFPSASGNTIESKQRDDQCPESIGRRRGRTYKSQKFPFEPRPPSSRRRLPYRYHRCTERSKEKTTLGRHCSLFDVLLISANPQDSNHSLSIRSLIDLV